MRKLIYIFLFSLLSFPIFGQNSDNYSTRLKAINNQDIVFYNIDGVNFSSQTFNSEFSEKGLKKILRKYSIDKKDVKVKDEKLTFNNYYVTKNELISENIIQNNSYYFVENEDKRVSVFWFGSINKQDRDFERKFVNLILENKIPKEVFESITIDSIDFAGRQIKLGSNCYWTNVNTVQCPYYGEMNWSIHKDLEDAQNSVENQLAMTKAKKGGKVVSEEIVDIEFEGNPTKAKRVIYDFTGVTSLLAGMSGGKTLTIYYVASEVRDNYVSCVLSFWNNDTITENGLAPLLEKVMKLK
jgi:hypothetical protein